MIIGTAGHFDHGKTASIARAAVGLLLINSCFIPVLAS